VAMYIKSILQGSLSAKPRQPPNVTPAFRVDLFICLNSCSDKYDSSNPPIRKSCLNFDGKRKLFFVIDYDENLLFEKTV